MMPHGEVSDLGSDDEDEEMLRLKLMRIEAKLKLKQLQRKRKRADTSLENGSDDTNKNGVHAHTRSRTDVGNGENWARNGQRYQRATTPVKQVLVAASPKKVPNSPSRILLGLDRGLRAKDISLKRPPNIRFGGVAANKRQGPCRRVVTSRTRSVVRRAMATVVVGFSLGGVPCQ